VVTTAQQPNIGQASSRTVGIAARGGLGQYFYFCMSLLVILVIVYGYSDDQRKSKLKLGSA